MMDKKIAMEGKVALVLWFEPEEWDDIIEIVRHVDEYSHLGDQIAAEYKKLRGHEPGTELFLHTNRMSERERTEGE